MQLKHKSLINKQNDKKMRLDKVDQFIKSILFIKLEIVKLQISQIYKDSNEGFTHRKVNKIQGLESNSDLKVESSFSEFKLLIEKLLSLFFFSKNNRKDTA